MKVRETQSYTAVVEYTGQAHMDIGPKLHYGFLADCSHFAVPQKVTLNTYRYVSLTETFTRKSRKLDHLYSTPCNYHVVYSPIISGHII